jgi:hypothetical protein
MLKTSQGYAYTRRLARLLACSQSPANRRLDTFLVFPPSVSKRFPSPKWLLHASQMLLRYTKIILLLS